MHKKKLGLALAAVLALAPISYLGGLQLFGQDAASETQDIIRTFPTISLYGPGDILVDRETWFAGEVSIYNPNSEAQSFERLTADIRGRGNSSWHDGPDKRPLRFRFPADEARGVLQFEHEAKTWILLANHFDPSLLRNTTALHLGGQMSSMPFTPVEQSVHLYFNGEYMGVYLLTDERDIGPGRASLILHDDPAQSEFFLEFDGRANQGADRWYDYVEVNNRLYDIRFPGGSRRSVAQGEYVHGFLTNVSNAIQSRDWDTITQWIDVDSMIDFYIVQELVKNMDFSFSSVFMTIEGQGENRRLHMGPLWDFDIVAGGVLFGYTFHNYVQEMNTPYGVIGPEHYWIRNLMFVPEFNEKLLERWQVVRTEYLPNTIAHIEYLRTHYQADFDRNFERHPILGTAVVPTTAPNLLNLTSHSAHVDYLLNFLDIRTQWLSGFWTGLVYIDEAPIEDDGSLWARGFNDAFWTLDLIHMLDNRYR